ncbi:MAG: GspMb/PilO family protein [Lentisphaerota bacterium]
MKISDRELGLAWMTAVVVLLGTTYWLGEPKLKEWEEFSSARQLLTERRVEAERWLNEKDGVEQRLNVLRKTLPKYPPEQDVMEELLRTIERLASEHSLTLIRRETDKERSVGDLYEVAITCTWEGELDALVHFLYALQVQGAILDIRQLGISPAQGGSGRLKGNFTVDCAYSREKAVAGTAEAGK